MRVLVYCPLHHTFSGDIHSHTECILWQAGKQTDIQTDRHTHSIQDPTTRPEGREQPTTISEVGSGQTFSLDGVAGFGHFGQQQQR